MDIENWILDINLIENFEFRKKINWKYSKFFIFYNKNKMKIKNLKQIWDQDSRKKIIGKNSKYLKKFWNIIDILGENWNGNWKLKKFPSIVSCYSDHLEMKFFEYIING